MKAVETHAYYVEIEIPRSRYPTAFEIRRVQQRDQTWLWKVTQAEYSGGSVLNRDLELEFERSPSSRTAEDLARTRYSSLDEALDYLGMLEKKLNA